MPRGIQKKGTSTAKDDTPVPIGAKTFPGTDEPIPDGVTVRSGRGVQIRFQLQGERCFETIAGRPTVGLVRQAIATRNRVLTLISLGKFKYEEEFPESRQVREMVRRARLKTKMPVVGEALDSWFALVADSVGPNTHDDYRRIIGYTLKPLPVSRLGIFEPHPCAGLDLQMLPVDELTPIRIATLRNQLFAVDGLSVKRVSNILIPLRGMMPMLVADKYLGADPFALLKPLKDTRVQADKPVAVRASADGPVKVEDVAEFKTGKGKADPFSPTEVRAILEVAYGQVLNMVTFWVDEGLRTGEILGLQWQDFDLAAGTVTVRRSVSKGKLKTLKKYEQRTIKLYPGAKAAVEAQVAFSGAQRAWVFLNPATGHRYANESKFTKRWKRLLAAAGVRYRRPYQLRHSTGSTLLSAGVSTIQAAYHLGHKDITMLARHYGHLIAEVANLPGATFEEKFEPIWAQRVELLRTRQQAPEGDDWLADTQDGDEAETDDGDDGEG